MRAVRKALRSPLVAGLLVGVLVSAAILGLRVRGYLETAELKVYDLSLRQLPLPDTEESRITLIGITEPDIQALGRWPLTDAILAKAVAKLLDYGPRAIGLDIYRDLPVPPGQEAFEHILRSHPNVIAVMKFGHDIHSRVMAPAVIRGTDQVGFNDLLVDRDGIVRRGLLFLDDAGEVAYSFALRVALLSLKAEGVVPQPDPVNPDHLRLGSTTFRPLEPTDGGYAHADARGYQLLLNFQGGRRSPPSFTLTSLLAGTVEPRMIRDKIVLIGVTAASVPDLFHIPYSSDLGSVYGVLLHAQIISQLIRAALEGDSPLTTLDDAKEAVWIVLWGLLGGGIGLVARSIWRFLLFSAGGLVILVLCVHMAFVWGWWIPSVPPAVSWVLAASLVTAYMTSQEKRQRAALMQLFSRHVSPEVAELIWQQREQFWEGGRPRSQHVIVTVLFTDLEGFTTVSEKMAPQALMDWTNTYIEIMAEVVMRHGGTVDDYYGDAIKANFGVPFPRSSEAEIKQDAVNAVNCALAMEVELRGLNEIWRAQHLPEVRMRIGIFTGPAVAGSLGSAQRLKYTTLGDTVNIAARLESFEKESWEIDAGASPCRILIGESTLRYVEERFVTKRIGDLTLKGKYEKVTVCRVLGRNEQPLDRIREEGSP